MAVGTGPLTGEEAAGAPRALVCVGFRCGPVRRPHGCWGPGCEQRAGRQPTWDSRLFSEHQQAPPLLRDSAPRNFLYLCLCPLSVVSCILFWLVTLEENSELTVGLVAV